MKYAQVDKEKARKCCREHTVFNDKKHKESDCDHCPLRRDFKAIDGSIRRGICWFILMNGLTEGLANTPFAQAEKAILEQEEISYPTEWIDWVLSHDAVEYIDRERKNYFDSED